MMRIVHDTREQQPYSFDGYAATVEAGTLQTGDYSLLGLHDKIALERKSLADLCGTLTTGRERFIRECERGQGLEYFGLIVESNLEDIRRHNYRSRATPQSLLQSLAAFSIRYSLHIHWCGNRAGGEYMTFSLLQKYLQEQRKRLETLTKAHGS